MGYCLNMYTILRALKLHQLHICRSPRSEVMTPGRLSISRSGQSLMTSISEPEGPFDLKFGGKHS